uniref:RyR/IP3R Homology associated domain-containing protein n=1 Tax=Amphimedon queenslandica TaxID=400682 RepID=A0A1X7T0P7_AMPQE
MKEQIIDKNKPIFANYEENVDPMESEELELIKKMLQMQLNEKDRGDLKKFLAGFHSQDKSRSNVAANDLKFVYNSGLFHIILEYTLKHNAYHIFYEQEVISCCFELLQGLAASSEKVRNEMFCYFSNFLQFKQVTNAMICLINEIFYGNTYVCNKLTKYDLGKVLYAAIIGPFDHYQWTIVLQTIIENSDQVEAQEHIAQLILKHSNDYLQHVLCPREQSKATYWLKILQCDKTDRQKNECHLLLNITDLLASCASGECQSARLVAMKLFAFNDLIDVLKSKDVAIMYRKLPFIRILTVTYLFDGSHFTANCSKYKELWSHINKTIMKFVLVEDKNITSKSHWAIHQQIVDGGKYMQPDRELEHVMELFYITDGVIPFLSKVCHEMSHQSSEKHICTKEELQSLREQLELLKNYRFVSEQLNRSEHLERINSLLEKHEINCLVATTWSASDGSINRTDSAENKIKLVRRDRSMPIEPQSNYYKEIYNLLKANNNNVRTVVIPALRNLVDLQKNKSLTYFKRIDVEETILRMLVLLQTVIKEAILPSEKYSLNEKELFEFVEFALYLNDCSNKEHTIFHLLQSQNNEIIFQVVELLKCFEEAPKEFGAPKKVQEMMISSCEAHDNIYIVQVHRLLREAEAHIKYNANHSQNDSTEIPKSKKGIAAALDLIILLCDWQQKDMQDAMRNKGSNIVNQVSFIFFYISKHWDDNRIDIAQKAVQALIEMCTGNYTNQEIAYKGQVIASINVILTSYHDDDKEKRKFKSSCLELLEVMLEEIDEKSWDLANRIANHLDMKSLRAKLKKIWKPTHSCAALRDFMCWKREDTLLAMRAYHVLRRIADYKCVRVEELVDQAEIKDGKMWKHYQEQSKSVQIVYKEYDKPDILTRVYFHNDPNIHIDLNLKDKIIRKIERFTPQEKLLNLLEWAKAVKEDNSEEKNKLRKHKVIHGMSLKTEKGRDFLLIFLTLILNLLILFTVKTPSDYNMPNGVCTANESYNETCNNSTSSSPMYFQPIWYPDIPVWSTVILTILGAIHVVLAVIMVIEYFTKKWGYITKFNDQKKKDVFSKIKEKSRKDKIIEKMTKWKKKISSFFGINQHNKRSEQMPLQSKKLISASILSYQSLYRIFFLICSALAFIPYPTTLKYFYCGCMLYPFMNSSAMKYILRAVRRSIFQLFTVLLLCLVITYIYAVISFAFLNNYFSEERDQFCGSIFECFVTVSHL